MIDRLLAVQSQDFPGAKWSVGQRVQGGTDALVFEAFQAGRILRTHVLRPTWHFVTPADIRWLLALTAPRVSRLNAYVHRHTKLDRAIFTKAHRVLVRELRDGRYRTRTELAAAFEQAGIRAATLRLAYLMMEAELCGLICSGPMRGKQHSYALLDERVPPTPSLTRDEALAELCRRFFEGHGPATVRHCSWWSGLTIAMVKEGLAALGADGPIRREIAGQTWYGGGPGGPVTGGYLIPEYDEALIGSADMPLTDLWPTVRKPTPRDPYVRPLILDGGWAGTWRRKVTDREVVLEIVPYARPSTAQRAALDRIVARYAAFLGAPLRSVTVLPRSPARG